MIVIYKMKVVLMILMIIMGITLADDTTYYAIRRTNEQKEMIMKVYEKLYGNGELVKEFYGEQFINELFATNHDNIINVVYNDA